jgi:flagellar biosynthesis protein FlhF
MIARAILETTLIQTQIDKKFQIFMGSSGSGKSTAMIKLAADLTLRQNKRVAIISTDTIKIGADEQMKVYSQMLNIPYVSIRAPADWDRVLPYLGGVDCVLVDCASLSLRNQDEVSYLQQMLPVSMQNEAQTHLVISAKTKDADVIEIANKYKIFHCEDLIFTGLDEVNNHGIIYNTVRKLNMPLFGFGIGPKVPDDFEYATVERVLDLILDITKKTQTTEQVL